jgi:hypothetical protein
MGAEADAEWEDSPEAQKVWMLVEGGDEWSVVFHTFYAGYIEFGTGPSHDPDPHGAYMPPIQPILEWVQRKLGYEGDKAKSVAYAIRQKIHESGTSPQPFARTAVFEAQLHLAELIEKELSLRPVMEYIALRSAENIDAMGINDSHHLENNIYVVHGGGA